MKLKPLIVGAILIAGGYALKYYQIFSNMNVIYGVMGVGAVAVILGLVTGKY